MHNWFARAAQPSAEPRPAVLGCHGKSPAYGDFVTRGMPPAVAADWDAMLQRMVEGSRLRLGEGWRAAWLEAPLWHFGLGEMVLSVGQVHGVLIPSVDRVGRYFPFTLLAESEARGLLLDDWRAAAESLALAALEDEFNADTLVQRLRALGPPDVEPGLDRGVAQWRCLRMGDAVRQCQGLGDKEFAAGLV